MTTAHVRCHAKESRVAVRMDRKDMGLLMAVMLESTEQHPGLQWGCLVATRAHVSFGKNLYVDYVRSLLQG